MKEASPRTFRIAFWRPWLLVLIPLGLLAAFGAAVAVGVGDRVAAVAILLGCAGVALALLLPIGIAVWISRWDVDPHGIGGRNSGLVYHRLAWAEIESIEPWLIPGYRYLQVNGIGRRWAFWLPLFLTDMPGFRAAVARDAPPDNPLRRYLEHHPA